MSSSSNEQIYATGRRKCAVACVRIQPGTGKIKVNDKPIENYFTTEAIRGYINQPLKVTDTSHSLDIFATVKGGGLSGQAGAIKHGISKALLNVDPVYRSVLKSAGFLTRDSRVKERKKYGKRGARASFQFSKR